MLPRSPKRKVGRPRKDASHTNSSPGPTTPQPQQASAIAPNSGQRGTRPRKSKEYKGKIISQNYVNGTNRIRYHIPSVAKHVARVIFMFHMDYFRAVKHLLGDDDHKDVHIHAIAENIEKDEQVQQFLKEELEVHGLDDASKESYLRELWDWFRHGSENKAMKAAGILGRGFVAEKVETTKPEELPISGIGDAVKSMLGSSNDERNESHESLDDVEVAESTSVSKVNDGRRPVLDAARPRSPKVH